MNGVLVLNMLHMFILLSREMRWPIQYGWLNLLDLKMIIWQKMYGLDISSNYEEQSYLVSAKKEWMLRSAVFIIALIVCLISLTFWFLIWAWDIVILPSFLMDFECMRRNLINKLKLLAQQVVSLKLKRRRFWSGYWQRWQWYGAYKMIFQ